MRIVAQRVREARVEVDGQTVGAIGKGLLVFFGVGKGDTENEVEWFAEKLSTLRVFTDENGKMNCGLLDVGGEMLVVSQFTLYGDISKGRRPSFDKAAPPEQARVLYEYFVQALRDRGVRVATGVFQAHMDVILANDGPVTLVYDKGTEG